MVKRYYFRLTSETLRIILTIESICVHFVLITQIQSNANSNQMILFNWDKTSIASDFVWFRKFRSMITVSSITMVSIGFCVLIPVSFFLSKKCFFILFFFISNNLHYVLIKLLTLGLLLRITATSFALFHCDQTESSREEE